MNKEQAILKLIEVIGGYRHPNYKHTVDKAKTYRRLITGAGMDELLQQFVRREDKDLFDQRCRLTKHVTKAVSNNLIDPVYEVARARYQVVLGYENTDDNKLKIVQKARAGYWGKKSVDAWMKSRFIKLNGTDPNAFHVVEFDPFDNTKEHASPYPFEAYSHNCVDYEYSNNLLQYLIVEGAVPVMEGSKKVKGTKLTAYLKDETIILTQISALPARSAPDGELFEIGGVSHVWVKSKLYQFSFPTPHNAGEVPAIRVGAFLDTETEDYTAVGLIDRVVEYLEKTVKINSELDLTMTMMAHPFILRYVEACDSAGCLGGALADGSSCSACGGSGKKKTPSTVAETMEVQMPKRLDVNLPALDSLITFKTPPIEIPQFQSDYIDGICEKAKRLMYSADTMTKRQTAMTATGENIDRQAMNNFLSVVGEHYSDVWEFVIRMIAKFTKTDAGLVAKLIFPKDFKLKGYDELIQDLKAVDGIGAPEIRRQINSDIVQVLYSDDEYALTRYRAKDLFNPFAGVSTAEVLLLLSSPLVLKRDKVLYANMGRIFDELEVEQAALTPPVNFYDLTKEKQKALINSKVDDILKQMEAETPALNIGG